MQDVFTEEASAIRAELPALRELRRALAAVQHIRQSEELASELRAGR
ncbi:hypothetical protein [Limimaricola soesokkakensis]